MTYYLTDPNQNTEENLWVLDSSTANNFGPSLENCGNHTLVPALGKTFVNNVKVRCENSGSDKNCKVFREITFTVL